MFKGFWVTCQDVIRNNLKSYLFNQTEERRVRKSTPATSWGIGLFTLVVLTLANAVRRQHWRHTCWCELHFDVVLSSVCCHLYRRFYDTRMQEHMIQNSVMDSTASCFGFLLNKSWLLYLNGFRCMSCVLPAARWSSDCCSEWHTHPRWLCVSVLQPIIWRVNFSTTAENVLKSCDWRGEIRLQHTHTAS